MITRYWKPVVAGLLAAILGVWLTTIAKHLWQDHLALHELAVIELKRQQGLPK